MEWMSKKMNEVFGECRKLREQGQKEYAHKVDNSFRNFEALASELELDRKFVLWIYFRKHVDGIKAYITGHKSQREDVRGRINDAIVYLCLLRGMLDEEESPPQAKFTPDVYLNNESWVG